MGLLNVFNGVVGILNEAQVLHNIETLALCSCLIELRERMKTSVISLTSLVIPLHSLFVDPDVTSAVFSLGPLPLLDHCEQTHRHHSEASLRLPLSGCSHSHDKHGLIFGLSHRLSLERGLNPICWLV